MDSQLISALLLSLGIGYFSLTLFGLNRYQKLKKISKDKFKQLKTQVEEIHLQLDGMKEDMAQFREEVESYLPLEKEREENDGEREESDEESDGEREKEEKKTNTPEALKNYSKIEDPMNHVMKLLSTTTSTIKHEILKANQDDHEKQDMVHQLFDLIDTQFEKIVNTGRPRKPETEDPDKTSKELLSDVRSILNQ